MVIEEKKKEEPEHRTSQVPSTIYPTLTRVTCTGLVVSGFSGQTQFYQQHGLVPSIFASTLNRQILHSRAGRPPIATFLKMLGQCDLHLCQDKLSTNLSGVMKVFVPLSTCCINTCESP